MISDEKRREVAAKLRADAESWRYYREDDSAFCMNDHVFTEAVLDDYGLDDMDMPAYEVFDQMADLIDRPTCNDFGDDWEFHCSACGCELYIREKEIGEPTMWKDGAAQVPKYCPSCGAEVVTTSD